MKQSDTESTLCPIARAASVIADRWTILILRELRLGNDKFDGLQAQTGMSSHLLARRLKAMEKDGLVARRLYHTRPKRFAYVVTRNARELDALLLMLRSWGMRHCGLDPKAESAMTMVHRRTGAVIDANWSLPEEDAPFSFVQVESRINAAWAAERAARAEAFTREKRAQVAKRKAPSRAGAQGTRRRKGTTGRPR
jgi:DNA-binding HxlR family transcriptional regulator